MSREKNDHLRSDAHNARGIELADRGWLDEAIKEFRKAIELDPGSAHAHDNLATVHSEKKQWREALAEYLTAIRLEPDSATAHYNLACFLATHGSDMAVVEYKEAIQLEPEYPDAHLNLGLTYADQGKVDLAVKQLERAIALAPEDPFARHELATIQMDEGDYRGAIAHLKEVVRLEAANFEAYKTQLKEMERSFGAMLRQLPGNSLVRNTPTRRSIPACSSVPVIPSSKFITRAGLHR